MNEQQLKDYSSKYSTIFLIYLGFIIVITNLVIIILLIVSLMSKTIVTMPSAYRSIYT